MSLFLPHSSLKTLTASQPITFGKRAAVLPEKLAMPSVESLEVNQFNDRGCLYLSRIEPLLPDTTQEFVKYVLGRPQDNHGPAHVHIIKIQRDTENPDFVWISYKDNESRRYKRPIKVSGHWRLNVKTGGYSGTITVEPYREQVAKYFVLREVLKQASELKNEGYQQTVFNVCSAPTESHIQTKPYGQPSRFKRWFAKGT